MRRFTAICVVTAALSLVGGLALAKDAAKGSSLRGMHANDTLGENIGVLGYDPVSYFPEGGGSPQKGSIKIATEHAGVVYRFASQEHLSTFQQNPEKYLPRYGGWCAWAVSELGKRVDVDPLSYRIRDGKLYLFYRDPSLDTRALWDLKADEMINRADSKWPALAK